MSSPSTPLTQKTKPVNFRPQKGNKKTVLLPWKLAIKLFEEEMNVTVPPRPMKNRHFLVLDRSVKKRRLFGIDTPTRPKKNVKFLVLDRSVQKRRLFGIDTPTRPKKNVKFLVLVRSVKKRRLFV